MADNVDVTPGTGKTFATDDIGGVQYPRAKMTWGPDGTANDTDVATGKPLPVQLRAATGQTLADTTGILVSTSQLATLNTTSFTYASGGSSLGVTGVALPTDQTKLPVHGNTAAGASDADNPLKIGGVGKTANPTAVTDGQRVNAIFDKLGKQVVVGAIRDLKGVTQTQISASTSETTIVAAVASTFCDLYGLILANTGATTTKVTIKDATAGTTRAIIEVPTLETRGFMVPVDSAVPQAVVNNNWTATCGSSTAALEVTAFWVKNL